MQQEHLWNVYIINKIKMKGLLGWQGWCFWWGFLRPNKKLYTITFNVIPTDAIVILDGEKGTSFSEQGTIIFHKYAGNYAYSVSKTGYVTQAGILTVSSNLIEKITLVLATASITFNVTPIDCVVVLDGETGTNTGGVVVFTKVPGSYTYSVSKTGYTPQTGTLNVSGDLVENVTLILATKSIKYGYLYNYNAISNAKFAPAGWHVPTFDELVDLANYVGLDQSDTLKENSLVYWNVDQGTNDYGFNGRGAGTVAMGFQNLTGVLYCGSSNLDEGTNQSILGLSIQGNNDIVTVSPTGMGDKTSGYSLRLIKNDSTLVPSLTDDGITYRTCKIGNQVWLADNWAGSKLNDGTPIPEIVLVNIWDFIVTAGMARIAYNSDEANVFL
jgi:uncharacterized protein (TIGR02145 family)